MFEDIKSTSNSVDFDTLFKVCEKNERSYIVYEVLLNPWMLLYYQKKSKDATLYSASAAQRPIQRVRSRGGTNFSLNFF